MASDSFAGFSRGVQAIEAMQIVFIGPPGSGKGTQAERLADHQGMVHLSTGELLRQARDSGTHLGCEAAEFFEAGCLVPDPLVLEIVAQRLKELQPEQGCLFDGFPRTLVQARALDELLAERGTPLDLAIEFKVDREELLRRLSARGRVDDAEETIRRRLDVYDSETYPLIEYYRDTGVLRSLDVVGSIDEIARKIELTVESV